jgi:lipopolysaccharide transport system permease protein
VVASDFRLGASTILALYSRRVAQDSAQGTGLGWYLADSLLYVFVHVLAFARSEAMKHEGLPSYLPLLVGHAAYVCCGILPWKAMTMSGATAARAFRSNHHFIRRLPVPPLVYALLEAAHHSAQFCVALTVLMAGMLCCGYFPHLSLLQVVPLGLLTLLVLCSISVALASTGTFWSSAPSAWSLISRILLWVTPIVYPRHVLPGWASSCLQVSPLWLFVEAYRDVLVRQQWLPPSKWVALLLATSCCLGVGLLIYEILADDVRDFV